jgi:ArsR family transcriptional regulator
MKAQLAAPRSTDLSDQTVAKLCDVFSLLANETRMRIVLYLSSQGEVDVTDLCERLGQSQPAVSHHLSLMRRAGLVRPRRSGKHIFYSVRADHFRMLMQCMAQDKTVDQPCDRFLECVFSGNGSHAKRP